MDIRPEDYGEIDELANARELIRLEEMRTRTRKKPEPGYQNLISCKGCGEACAPIDSGLCVFCVQDRSNSGIEPIDWRARCEAIVAMLEKNRHSDHRAQWFWRAGLRIMKGEE